MVNRLQLPAPNSGSGSPGDAGVDKKRLLEKLAKDRIERAALGAETAEIERDTARLQYEKRQYEKGMPPEPASSNEEQLVIDPDVENEEDMVKTVPKGKVIQLPRGRGKKEEGEKDAQLWSIGEDGRPYKDPEGEYTFAQIQKVIQLEKAKSKNELLEVMKWMKENQMGPGAGGGQGDPFTNTLMQKLAEKAVENLAGGNARVESKSGLAEFLQFFGVTDKESLMQFAQILSGGGKSNPSSGSLLPITLKDSKENPIGSISLTLPEYLEVKTGEQEMRHKQEKHEATMGLFEMAKVEGGRSLRAWARSKEQAPEPPQQGNVPQINQPQMDYRQCGACGMIFGVPKGITHFMCPNPECPNNKQPELPPEQPAVEE